jgi:hypothetical protein
MAIERIEDEEHLLRLYYEAQRKVIYERSGSLEEDIADLNRQVMRYARVNELSRPLYLEDA